MLTRLSFGVGAGAVATALLFLLMQELIESDESPFEELAMGAIVDFVPVVEDMEVKSTRQRPEKPPPPDEPPPDMPEVEIDRTQGEIGSEIGPPKKETVKPFVQNGGFADGNLLPIVKVRPVYPSRAAARGIEGYVLLQFTVSRTGTVRDPLVVNASPPGVFDRAAKEAALKFRYKPRVVNGTPVEVSGVRNHFTFSLRDG